MTKLQDIADKLETRVDHSGIDQVITALGLVCSDKADHVRENYSDETLADSWDLLAGFFVMLPDSVIAAIKTIRGE